MVTQTAETMFARPSVSEMIAYNHPRRMGTYTCMSVLQGPLNGRVEMPDQVTQVFIRNYSNHSNRLTEALLSLNIESVQQTLTEFWTSIPIYLYSQMDHNEAAITIGRLDERIYSTVVNSWIPDPVRPRGSLLF